MITRKSDVNEDIYETVKLISVMLSIVGSSIVILLYSCSQTLKSFALRVALFISIANLAFSLSTTIITDTDVFFS